MPSRFIFAILAAALSISPASAQVRGAGAAGPGISAGSAGSAQPEAAHRQPGLRDTAWFLAPHASIRGVGQGEVRCCSRIHIFIPIPIGYDPGEGRAAPGDRGSGSTPAPPPAPAAPRESLLIEWQGDHFVRTTMSAKPRPANRPCPTTRRNSRRLRLPAGRSATGRKSTVETPRQLPPAVLVFHDGRREEVSEYAIMSGTIYSKADYWTTGYWTRKIQIADLDVPATLRLNQERGVKFVLPASPNEVVVRP